MKLGPAFKFELIAKGINPDAYGVKWTDDAVTDYGTLDEKRIARVKEVVEAHDPDKRPLGETLLDDLVAAGISLDGIAFAPHGDITYADSVSEATRAAVAAVVAKHDHTATRVFAKINALGTGGSDISMARSAEDIIVALVEHGVLPASAFAPQLVAKVDARREVRGRVPLADIEADAAARAKK